MSQISPPPISKCAAETLSQSPRLIAESPTGHHRMRLVSHRLSAGFPSPAADYAEDGLDLNDYLVRNKPASFMFTVKGDSMMNAGIVEGDKVIVDRSVNAKSKDIVVAVVNGEYTIKRLYKTTAKWNCGQRTRPTSPSCSKRAASWKFGVWLWG